MSFRQPISSLPESLLYELQTQKQQIHKIKQQRDTITDLHETFKKKDKQISRLNTLLDKYKTYYEKYSSIKVELQEKSVQIERKQKQNKFLIQEVQELMRENEEMRKKLKSSEVQSKQIEQTFKEYQTQCKNKEKGYLYDLERAYQQIKELTQKIDQYEVIHFDNEQLRAKIKEHQIEKNEGNRSNKRKQLMQQGKKIEELKEENARLMAELLQKQNQLQRSKLLNHQLSISFDKSVKTICEFEEELSEYRRQNHQLKKTMRLFLENQQCQKIYQQKLKNKIMEEEEDSLPEQSSSGDEGRNLESRMPEQSSPEMSQVKF